MGCSDTDAKEYVKRLLLSRMRILMKNGFYGLLLMHMGFALDSEIPTACTDGRKIYFCPKFINELSDGELDFVLMHEILHVALRHCLRTGDRDPQLFNIACDIVVNSNILLAEGMDINAVTIKKYGALMHKAPNGEEGNKYTAEEVYEMLIDKINNASKSYSGGVGGGGKGANGNADKILSRYGYSQGWDDHSRWGSDDGMLADEWQKYVRDAYESISARIANGGRGTLPLGAERLLKELSSPRTDWRTLLADFVQEEINDYSFSPPDKRYEGDFFLPDFNDTSDSVRNILFMVDASGSISDDMLAAAYSEIKGAIDQFDGKLSGHIGFFDSVVYEPKPFESVDELLSIKPRGGGGTDFFVIFKYVFQRMADNLPASIVILTDGCAPFPKADIARGVPVLWLINDDSVTPPWGKVARMNK